MTAYDMDKSQAQAVQQPFISSVGIVVDPPYTEFDSYYAHYDHYWGPSPDGIFQVGTSLVGGRLMPQKMLPSFNATVRQLVELGVVNDVSRFGKDGVCAVLPQWRTSIVMPILSVPWNFDVPCEDTIAEQSRITYDIMPLIEASMPSTGAYMNEADVQQPDWQETFFGINYPRLLEIKRKHDPEGLLYVRTGAGSEDWRQR